MINLNFDIRQDSTASNFALNSIDSFSNIYPELYRDIFRFCMSDPPHQFLEKMSLVCHHWHNISIDLRKDLINNGTPLDRVFNFRNKSKFDVKRLQHLEKEGPKLHCLKFTDPNCCRTITQIISDEELGTLVQLKELRKLDLSYCSEITHVGLESLSQLKMLEELNIDPCSGVKENLFETIAFPPKLHTLKLANFSTIDEEKLAKLSRLTELHTLSISDIYELDDSALSVLAKLTGLRSLSLHQSPERYCYDFTTSKLENFSSLTQLTALSLYDISMLDSSFEAIGKLVQLKTFELEWPLSDTLLKEIGRLTKLCKLCLYDTSKMTDQGLLELALLTNLQQLTLSTHPKCTQLTQIGINTLASLSPHINIRKIPLD